MFAHTHVHMAAKPHYSGPSNSGGVAARIATRTRTHTQTEPQSMRIEHCMSSCSKHKRGGRTPCSIAIRCARSQARPAPPLPAIAKLVAMRARRPRRLRRSRICIFESDRQNAYIIARMTNNSRREKIAENFTENN